MPIVKYYTAQVCLAQGIAVYGEKNPSQILLAYATSVFWLHSVHLSSMPWENPPLSTPNILIFNVVRDLNKGGAGGAIAPPHFGRIEGAAGQRQRAALLLAPPV